MANICDRTNCLGDARWTPVLELRTKGHKGPPALFHIPVCICNECKPKTEIDDLMTDEGWKQLCEAIKGQGREKPTRKLTKIRWKEVPNVQDN